MSITREVFCELFVTSFCGAWCAKHYEDACMKDQHDMLRNPPIEDANDLANSTWLTYKKYSDLTYED